MCFSAEASFAAGTVLLGIGTLTWRSARRPAERPFAAIPLLFAIQQFIEGTIWLTFSHESPQINTVMTYAYTLFSHALWPVFVPMSVWLIEPPGWRRQWLRGFVAAGGVVSAWLLYSIAAHGIASRPTGRHIEYVMPYVLGELTMTLYLLSTGASLLLSTHRTVKAFGVLAVISFGAAYAIYATWFISVWCYFAAVLSMAIFFHLNTGPALLRLSRT